MFLKCGEWTYLFVTNVANGKILLDIAGLDSCKGEIYFVEKDAQRTLIVNSRKAKSYFLISRTNIGFKT